MSSVLVGVHVHAEPARLLATLAAVEYPVLLLADGPDGETQAALDGLAHLPQSGTTQALGAAACFNRLAAKPADVVIFLESGSVPAPGALEMLVEALEREQAAGLAGPSTNSAWNDQAAFPDASESEIAQTARAAQERFGTETRTLEPLYSLADFCYAVRREVVATIGAADEAYSLGPCWEMDYNARAARAGFRGLWVCGAYVHRAPFTPRRRREEAARLEASKRLYQDRFCGLRLRGDRVDYESHCRGDACEHFAPPGLVRLTSTVPGVEPYRAPAAAAPARPREPRPLVSCIMPTRDRAELALQAVRYFQRQDYGERELVIVDDGRDGLEQRLPDDGRLRYVRAPEGETIGAKRNRAVAAARGELLAHWDDDDWYAPARLRRQVEPLLAGDGDITGLAAGVFFDLSRWSFWTCTPRLHRRLFVGDVHGGTLVYRRSVWERHARYPNASLAEDASFLRQALRRGARLRRLPNDGLFVYLRHEENSWAFPLGSYLDPRGWVRAGEPPMPPADRAFYAARSAAAPSAPADERHGLPLVSCLLPTADRREFVAQAVAYYLRQDYANRELVVLDDGGDRVEDLIPPDPSIRYVGLDRRLVLGAKRNLACELARGDLLAHWDDDDWSAPHRLRYQVEELERAAADACGISRQLCLDPVARRAWLYRYPPSARPWLAGNALLYRRGLWQRRRFPEVGVGEDTRFIFGARRARLLDLDDHRFHVAIVHARNTSPKRTDGTLWHPVEAEEVEALLGDDLPFYRVLAAASA